MDNAQFEALVDRLDVLARNDPAGYRARVIGLALLGYGYLAALVAVLLLLTAVAVASVVKLKALGLKLALVIGGFLWVVLRSLWVRLEAPEGTPLERRDAPDLFAMLDRLRGKLATPRIHAVLLTDDFNAGAAQVPRLGLFGWHRNYVLVGLPLLKALTPGQFEAVLAHELGHLAGGHGRLGHWIYRLRLMWARLEAALQAERHWGTFAVKPFFEWYVPRFSAWSFPLARADEYEADAAAARLATARTAATALCGVEVAGRFLGQKFWPGVHAEADRTPVPQFAPFATFRPAIPGTEADDWLAQAMQRPTTRADTHPALRDRLAALDESPELALPATGESADRLLGASLERLTQAFDERWRARIAPSWQQRHQYVQEARAKLDSLRQSADGTEPGAAAALERALLEEDVGQGAEAALAELRSLQARFPQDPPIAYALGSRLLARDDAAGVGLVQGAIGEDDEYLLPGAEALRDYYWRQGDAKQAQSWDERLLDRARVHAAARAERDQIFTNDDFEPHGLDAGALTAMIEALRAIPRLREVYLVRKRVAHLPQSPLHVLGFVITPFWAFQRRKRVAEVQQQLVEAIQWPGDAFVLCVEGDNKAFRKKFRRVDGSRIL